MSQSQILLKLSLAFYSNIIVVMLLHCTGVARNFDWGGGSSSGAKCKILCNVILVPFFGDVMAITSLK